MAIEAIFKNLGIENPEQIGKGGEGDVFALDMDRVVKIYKRPDSKYLKELMDFQMRLGGFGFSFTTPQILETYETYSIERRLSGSTLDKVFPNLNGDQQNAALDNYYQAMRKVNAVKLPDRKFGQVLGVKDAVTTDNWPEFLIRKLDQQVEKTGVFLRADVANFDTKLAKLKQLIVSELDVQEKHLVHGDYYLNNVLVDKDQNIAAVMDFSVHTVVGDPRLDAASILFLKMYKEIKPEQIERLYKKAEADYGEGVRRILDIYGLYYSVYYSGTHNADPESYEWCIDNLNNEEVWGKL